MLTLVFCLAGSSLLHAAGVASHRPRFDRGEGLEAGGGGNKETREPELCQPAPITTAVTKYPDIVYATVPRGDGEGTFGLMLDAYVPSPGNFYPALIWVHGGGWVSGSRTTESGTGSLDEIFAHFYAYQGPFVVFTIDYRMPCDPTAPYLEYWDSSPHLSPRAAICSPAHKHPVPLADVRAAIEWVRNNGAQFNADPTKIGIVGDSTGGHLALLAATYDGAATMARLKPRVAVGFSPAIDFALAAQSAVSNDGTPSIPWPLDASSHGAEFDECAFVEYVAALDGLGWMNTEGRWCAARWFRMQLVGQDYEPGDSPEAVASRGAWDQASPRYWVGTTDFFHPDPPVYFFIGESELRILEQEGQSFIDAAGEVPTMAGSAFCKLSAGNAMNYHASNLAGAPVEPGCPGYDSNATGQIRILDSTLLFLQKYLPHCE